MTSFAKRCTYICNIFRLSFSLIIETVLLIYNGRVAPYCTFTCFGITPIQRCHLKYVIYKTLESICHNYEYKLKRISKGNNTFCDALHVLNKKEKDDYITLSAIKILNTSYTCCASKH